MSTDFRTCPGCKTMILSDTYECPHCGHVFDARKSKQSAAAPASTMSDLKSANLHEECRSCGVMVRVGLVRCWNCNAFMREDIARRYEMMTTTPQKIIFSEIPEEDRTDYLPARSSGSGPATARRRSGGGGGDEDGFTLQDDVSSSVSAGDSEFELDGGFQQSPSLAEPRVPSVPAQKVTGVSGPSGDGPDKPQSTTPGGKTAQPAASGEDGDGAEKPLNDDALASAADKFGKAMARTGGKSIADVDSDDLHAIAMQEQREFRRRRVEKLAEARRKRIMIPCPGCGAWIRVQEEQAGRTLRCPQCKGPVAIPELKKKPQEKKADKGAPQPVVELPWIEDVKLHLLNPTALVLKPGSLADQYMLVDIAITPRGLVIVNLNKDSGKKKKSFLGKSSGPTPAELQERRKQVRPLIAAETEVKDHPQVEVQTIGAENVAYLRLVQPVAKVHESMFAGVPVFGDGRVAIYVPIDGGNGQQVFCSLTISQFRDLSNRLFEQHQVRLPGSENGVPESDKSDSLMCFYSQAKFESVQNLVYYQQDSAYELAVSGHRCAACGITISEEGRQKNKLGGANGKGIAKAKCPKCGGKFGTLPLYKITKSPSTPKPAEASAESSQPAAITAAIPAATETKTP